jgi:hypothetical protein
MMSVCSTLRCTYHKNDTEDNIAMASTDRLDGRASVCFSRTDAHRCVLSIDTTCSYTTHTAMDHPPMHPLFFAQRESSSQTLFFDSPSVGEEEKSTKGLESFFSARNLASVFFPTLLFSTTTRVSVHQPVYFKPTRRGVKRINELHGFRHEKLARHRAIPCRCIPLP